MTSNKRKRTRVPFDVDVHFDTDDKHIHSQKLQDISMSGLYFDSDVNVPLGTTGTVKLHLESGEQTIVIIANVIVTRSIQADANTPRGIGVTLCFRVTFLLSQK